MQNNRMAERMRQRPMALRMLLACNQGMTWLVMIAYPLLLLYLLFLKRYEMLYHTVLIPGVAFVVVSVFRRIYNAPRPYEKMDITPLIAKDKQGQSFPSRHVFSAGFWYTGRYHFCSRCISFSGTCARWCSLFTGCDCRSCAWHCHRNSRILCYFLMLLFIE